MKVLVLEVISVLVVTEESPYARVQTQNYTALSVWR